MDKRDLTAARAISEAALAFSKAESRDELWGSLHRHVAPYGITAALYGAEVMPRIDRETVPLLCSIKPEWLREKTKNGSFHRDEYVRAMRTNTKPVLWSDMTVIDGMSEAARKSFAIDAKHKVTTGVSISMRFERGFGASAIGLQAAGMAGREFERIWQQNQETITGIVNAFDVALRCDHKDQLFELSHREREVLLWRAHGYRAQQIADRKKLSDKTTARVLDDIRKKLQATTLAQAVASALIFGLIDP